MVLEIPFSTARGHCNQLVVVGSRRFPSLLGGAKFDTLGQESHAQRTQRSA